MTREEQIARMSQTHRHHTRAEPESDFKTSAKWKPSTETPTRNIAPASQSCSLGKFAPDVMAETRSEAQETPAQHPDLFERVDVMIFRTRRFWDKYMALPRKKKLRVWEGLEDAMVLG
ncbi:uncharacterized protein ATNIH1004_002000 [Aspergillus tanneri]|uniref:Uncharacterized protein n=1 Tax=Aspergillus tanneri TaxID=1220188 RepID=A0A5M9M2R4_9EURO|nr:uncharacterized protein ATNIH1004_002000 [Aspergillus tanneri]KAA8641332.1 hypothetical protein ATNIH1004_002000 [Aspergillus tanneri]